MGMTETIEMMEVSGSEEEIVMMASTISPLWNSIDGVVGAREMEWFNMGSIECYLPPNNVKLDFVINKLKNIKNWNQREEKRESI